MLIIFLQMDFPKINPWSVENLEEFLYFCCPECDDRNQSRNTFLEHALHQHPTSKEYLLKFIVKNEILLEENFNESESNGTDDNQIIPSLIVKCDIKEEYDKAVVFKFFLLYNHFFHDKVILFLIFIIFILEKYTCV